MKNAIAAATRKADNAIRDARQARQPASAPVVVQPAPVVEPAAAPAGLAACGTGSQGEEVYADSSTTSCAFALNVESDYWQTSAMQFTSYSPATGQSYVMSATDNGTSVTATGGSGALVEFSDGN